MARKQEKGEEIEQKGKFIIFYKDSVKVLKKYAKYDKIYLYFANEDKFSENCSELIHIY